MTGGTTETRCAYCGLPVQGVSGQGLPSRGSARSVGRGPWFCCYGCRVADAITSDGIGQGNVQHSLTRLGLAIFFAMNVMVFTLALWSWDVYRDEPLSSPQADALFELFRYLSLLLSSVVIVMLGAPLLEDSLEKLRRGNLSTDLLIGVGVVAAFLYSVASLLRGDGHTYFEVACMVLVGVTLGRWLEALGKEKTTRALRSLERLLPESVDRVRPAGGEGLEEVRIPLEQVEPGDWLRVRPGQRIATDGRIRRGQAAIDQKIVTGESLPAIKEAGDEVFAGSLNQDGDLLVEVTAAPRAGALARIVQAVSAATAAKGKIETAADRIAQWFLPCVIGVALLTLVGHAATGGIGRGLMAALSVLLIACPCALGIATPLAIWAAMGRASEVGLLFRNGDAMQSLAATRVICFDKTGTLTDGQTVVTELVVDAGVSPSEVLSRALSLASSSDHGCSHAIRAYATERLGRQVAPFLPDVQVRPGRGLVAGGKSEGGPILLGNLALVEDAGMAFSATMRQAQVDLYRDGKPLALVAWEGQVQGVFVFAERLRNTSAAALQALRAEGFHVTVLTGDHGARANSLARELNVEVQADLLPEEKLAAIQQLRARYGAVAMVGDGINDAPALAEADAGIALGCGADVSREAADVCLLGNDLHDIGWSIRLARRTMTTIRQNLFWAFAYNVVGIGLATMGWLNPIWAAAAMVGSSLLVIWNSLRLLSVSDRQAEQLPAADRAPGRLAPGAVELFSP